MPLNATKLLIVLRAQTTPSQQRELSLSYEVLPESTPAPGLNLTTVQKTKLADRLQQMALLLDENDTVL